jgi:nucleotide-binding universal stress UspA family protein
MYRRILVANDGSDGAFKALTAALRLASETQAELHMVSVAQINSMPTAIAEVDLEREVGGRRFGPAIERAKRLAAFRGLEIECHVLFGSPILRIADFAAAHSFDLLVVGATEHSPLYRRIVGSTTDQLVSHAPCAVLVAK